MILSGSLNSKEQTASILIKNEYEDDDDTSTETFFTNLFTQTLSPPMNDNNITQEITTITNPTQNINTNSRQSSEKRKEKRLQIEAKLFNELALAPSTKSNEQIYKAMAEEIRAQLRLELYESITNEVHMKLKAQLTSDFDQQLREAHNVLNTNTLMLKTECDKNSMLNLKLQKMHSENESLILQIQKNNQQISTFKINSKHITDENLKFRQEISTLKIEREVMKENIKNFKKNEQMKEEMDEKEEEKRLKKLKETEREDEIYVKNMIEQEKRALKIARKKKSRNKNISEREPSAFHSQIQPKSQSNTLQKVSQKYQVSGLDYFLVDNDIKDESFNPLLDDKNTLNVENVSDFKKRSNKKRAKSMMLAADDKSVSSYVKHAMSRNGRKNRIRHNSSNNLSNIPVENLVLKGNEMATLSIGDRIRIVAKNQAEDRKYGRNAKRDISVMDLWVASQMQLMCGHLPSVCKKYGVRLKTLDEMFGIADKVATNYQPNIDQHHYLKFRSDNHIEEFGDIRPGVSPGHVMLQHASKQDIILQSMSLYSHPSLAVDSLDNKSSEDENEDEKIDKSKSMVCLPPPPAKNIPKNESNIRNLSIVNDPYGFFTNTSHVHKKRIKKKPKGFVHSLNEASGVISAPLSAPCFSVNKDVGGIPVPKFFPADNNIGENMKNVKIDEKIKQKRKSTHFSLFKKRKNRKAKNDKKGKKRKSFFKTRTKKSQSTSLSSVNMNTNVIFDQRIGWEENTSEVEPPPMAFQQYLKDMDVNAMEDDIIDIKQMLEEKSLSVDDADDIPPPPPPLPLADNSRLNSVASNDDDVPMVHCNSQPIPKQKLNGLPQNKEIEINNDEFKSYPSVPLYGQKNSPSVQKKKQQNRFASISISTINSELLQNIPLGVSVDIYDNFSPPNSSPPNSCKMVNDNIVNDIHVFSAKPVIPNNVVSFSAVSNVSSVSKISDLSKMSNKMTFSPVTELIVLGNTAGIEIRAQFGRLKANSSSSVSNNSWPILLMVIHNTNVNGLDLNHVNIVCDKNYVGLNAVLSKYESQINIAYNSYYKINVPLVIEESKSLLKNGMMNEIIVDENSFTFYVNTNLCSIKCFLPQIPIHIFFSEDGSVKRDEYLREWKKIDSKVLQRKLIVYQCRSSNMDHIKLLLMSHQLFLIHHRSVKNMGNVLYYTCRMNGTLVMIEISISLTLQGTVVVRSMDIFKTTLVAHGVKWLIDVKKGGRGNGLKKYNKY